jgi:hypothetical protein
MAELAREHECGERRSGERGIALTFNFSPSTFTQSETLPYDKDVNFTAGNEPIVQPGDAVWFVYNPFNPYPSGAWNGQINFVVYFKF